MENAVAHGIGVKNRYALFYEDEDADPFEMLRQKEEEKLKRKSDKAQNKEKGKASKTAKPTAPAPQKPKDAQPVKNIKATENIPKPKGKPFSERPPRNTDSFQEQKPNTVEKKNFRNREDTFGFEPKDRDGEFRRGRGGYRGRGGRDRGRGYMANTDGRPRRAFDRHSGSDKTGVRAVDKRDGGGSNNWGDARSEGKREVESGWGDEDELDTSGDKLQESVNFGEEGENAGGNTSGKENEGADTEAKENEPVVEVPVVKEMTLDEWKREQEAKRAIPKYNLRKPGEGEDDKQWKKCYMLKKKVGEEDEDEDDDEEDDDDEVDEGRKGQHRQLLDIQINFSDSRRGRGRGRGGRGGPRNREFGGRGGEGGDRVREPRPPGSHEPGRFKKANQQSAPRVDDFNDFPSLVQA